MGGVGLQAERNLEDVRAGREVGRKGMEVRGRELKTVVRGECAAPGMDVQGRVQGDGRLRLVTHSAWSFCPLY
jgi:hypothetical protein